MLAFLVVPSALLAALVAGARFVRDSRRSLVRGRLRLKRKSVH